MTPPEDREAAIGAVVADLRGTLSQKALAEKMRERGWKWSQATVWSVEQGERPLRLAESVDLAEILEAELTDLVESTPPLSKLARAIEDQLGQHSGLFWRIRAEIISHYDQQRELAWQVERLSQDADGEEVELVDEGIESLARNTPVAALTGAQEWWEGQLEESGERLVGYPQSVLDAIAETLRQDAADLASGRTKRVLGTTVDAHLVETSEALKQYRSSVSLLVAGAEVPRGRLFHRGSSDEQTSTPEVGSDG